MNGRIGYFVGPHGWRTLNDLGETLNNFGKGLTVVAFGAFLGFPQTDTNGLGSIGHHE